MNALQLKRGMIVTPDRKAVLVTRGGVLRGPAIIVNGAKLKCERKIGDAWNLQLWPVCPDNGPEFVTAYPSQLERLT